MGCFLWRPNICEGSVSLHAEGGVVTVIQHGGNGDRGEFFKGAMLRAGAFRKSTC